jgi:tRNA(Ile)-lysidine synthase
MANTKKSLKNSKKATIPVAHPLVSQLNQFLGCYLMPSQRVLLALSGGLDSSVLLHLLAVAKQAIPFELHAMHVHHGLSTNADAWADFCTQQCQLLNVPIEIVRVQVDKNSKLGIEAAARQLRYEALFDFKADGVAPDYIVTAHHQDDQAETLLLQLFRGAGVKGLASMAEIDEPRRLMRPLLGASRQALQEYATQHRIAWCDDESNDNTQYERNFVRHDVMPMLASRYPALKSVLARTASHLAEANDLLDDLAKIDAEHLLQNNSLSLQGLTAFDLSRTKNLLRWWFSQNQLSMPTSEHLTEIIQQLFTAKPDANIHIQLQDLSLKRYQKRAYLCSERSAESFDMVWNGEPLLNLPNGGQLHFKQVTGAGLALKHGMTKLRITNRDGGERFKPDVLRPTRTLKHLLQEANIPPWQREHLPLIYWHDTLALVPNIGIAHELQASENEQGLEITWQDKAV